MRTAVLPPPQPTHDEADRLFEALDHRLIGHGDSRWLSLVTAVICDGRDWWVQVGASDAETRVFLRVSRFATPAHAVAALETCQDPDDEHPPIVDVMRPH